MKTKDSYVFTMRLPAGEKGSLEQQFLEKSDRELSKANFMRHCLYGGYILNEIGLLDKLIEARRSNTLKDKSMIETLQWFQAIIGKPPEEASKEKQEEAEKNYWTELAQ